VLLSAPAPDAEVILRAAGLRVTRPRLAVLSALAGGPHSTVDAVVAAVRGEVGSVSVQAVYDVLRVLGRAGLVRRIDLAGAPSRYEVRVGDNHHHVVCRGCGVTSDVDCAVGAAPCLEPADTHGFVVDEAEVTYWGICPACRDRQQQHDLPIPRDRQVRPIHTAEGAP
jgi:Fur family ferric uptake transcriptional regulator